MNHLRQTNTIEILAVADRGKDPETDRHILDHDALERFAYDSSTAASLRGALETKEAHIRAECAKTCVHDCRGHYACPNSGAQFRYVLGTPLPDYVTQQETHAA